MRKLIVWGIAVVENWPRDWLPYNGQTVKAVNGLVSLVYKNHVILSCKLGGYE